ncbi:MAG TPA: hypothetical protein VGM27_26625 [Acidobacteriaceae bacterium]
MSSQGGTAFGVGRHLKTVLPVYVGVTVTLLSTAFVAVYFPARRAGSTNPTQALRSE